MTLRRFGDTWIPKWSLWPLWILASVLGTILAGLLGTEVGWYATIRVFPSFHLQSIVFDSAATGALLGTLQWIVLRRYLSNMRLWIVATVLGVLLSDLILIATAGAVDLLGLYPDEGLVRSFLLAFVWGTTGATLASIQWLAIRTQGIVGLGFWTLANGAGAALGAMLTPIRLAFIPGRPAFDLHEDFYLYVMFAVAPAIGQSLVAGYVLAARIRPRQPDLQTSPETAS
jgi:hypothetical protein